MLRRAPSFLFVCTANINRSPVAEAWARKILANDYFVAAQVRSASAMGWSGDPAGAYTIDAMRELGFDLREHRSTALTAELLQDADRVIVMEPGHAERALALSPDIGPRIVGLGRWLLPATDSVPDPHGGNLDDHRIAARAIGEAVQRLIPDLLAERRAARAAR